MKFQQLIKQFVNSREKRPRKIGRYWATDILPIMKGEITPENFLIGRKEVDLEGAKMIATGIFMEQGLREIFTKCGVLGEFDDKKTKKEIKITSDITLVTTPDFVLSDKVIETKFPFGLMKKDEIPDRYKYQLECEYRAYYKRTYLGVLSIPFNLTLIEYFPSQWRWRQIQNLLIEFHKKVVKYNKN